MNRRELPHLLAERTALQRMIDETPQDDVIDLASLQAKFRLVEEQLASQGQGREPARAKLTFSGRPVIGSHGILADFGMKAVNGFTEAVVAVAASLTAPLRSKGPIPNRGQNQFLITNIAFGSFGFELQEFRAEQLELSEPSSVEQALIQTQALLLAAVEDDDDGLADSIAELDQRAIDKVRTFVSTLEDNGALCALQIEDKVFRFKDTSQIRRTIARMSAANLHEERQELCGRFEGVLPNTRRTFEFRIDGSREVLVGKIGSGVEHPEVLNNHLNELCTISVVVTRVGTGHPRYLLEQAPRWESPFEALPA